jgi:hypothetical protein
MPYEPTTVTSLTSGRTSHRSLALFWKERNASKSDSDGRPVALLDHVHEASFAISQDHIAEPLRRMGLQFIEDATDQAGVLLGMLQLGRIDHKCPFHESFLDLSEQGADVQAAVLWKDSPYIPRTN